jgi:hypothetical protein
MSKRFRTQDADWEGIGVGGDDDSASLQVGGGVG